MGTRVVGDDIDTRRMTTASIGFALDHHQRTGAIKGWYSRRDPRGDRWIVVMAGTGPFQEVEARTKREVGILIAGLISAESGARAKAGQAS
jgi:hypothetical protein